jgi:hypothetical protein
MKTNVVLVTPDYASKLLEKNTDNRKIRVQVVNQLVEVIKNGAWCLTHQGIAISEDGVILDGQHRLSAIVKSNIAVKMAVSTDVPKEAFKAIDIGVKRTLQDMFKDEKKTIEIVRLAACIHLGTSTISPDVFEEYFKSPLTAHCRRLMEHTGAVRKIFTVSGNRLGAVLLAHKYKNEDYPFSQYRACALMDFDSMSRYTMSYFKHISEHGYKMIDNLVGGQQLHAAALVYSFKAFDPERRDLTMFKVLKTERPAILEESRILIEDIVTGSI